MFSTSGHRRNFSSPNISSWFTSSSGSASNSAARDGDDDDEPDRQQYSTPIDVPAPSSSSRSLLRPQLSSFPMPHHSTGGLYNQRLIRRARQSIRDSVQFLAQNLHANAGSWINSVQRSMDFHG
jgi:hypothetical protein